MQHIHTQNRNLDPNPSELSKPPKLLSLCVAGRNDDYTTDFLYRLSTCINFTAKNLRIIGRLDDVEFLVTDWGSRNPLSEALNLTSEGQYIAKFIHVHPDPRKDHSYSPNSFNTSLAYNVSLRRGTGKFLAICGTDILIPQNSLEILLRLLEGDIEVNNYPVKQDIYCLWPVSTSLEHRQT